MLVDQAMLNMTLGADGSIYYALGKDLYRIAVPDTDATLRELRLNDEPLAGFAPGITEYYMPGLRASSRERRSESHPDRGERDDRENEGRYLNPRDRSRREVEEGVPHPLESKQEHDVEASLLSKGSPPRTGAIRFFCP